MIASHSYLLKATTVTEAKVVPSVAGLKYLIETMRKLSSNGVLSVSLQWTTGNSPLKLVTRKQLAVFHMSGMTVGDGVQSLQSQQDTKDML